MFTFLARIFKRILAIGGTTEFTYSLTSNNMTVKVHTLNNNTTITINDTLVYSGPALRGNISTINGKVFIGDHEVSMEGVKITPVFNFVINGPVTGNVASGSGDVVVHSDVAGSVSSGSGDVDVKGSVEGSVTTGSGDVDVTGYVNDYVKTGSGEVHVDGDVTGNISTMSGDVTVEGSLNGTVTTVSGNVSNW